MSDNRIYRQTTAERMREVLRQWIVECHYDKAEAALTAILADEWRAGFDAGVVAHQRMDAPLSAWEKYRPDDLTDDELAEYVIQSKGILVP